MDMGMVVSHYPMLKFGKVCKGISPTKDDLNALAQKVELATWDLASFCIFSEHMDDLPEKEK